MAKIRYFNLFSTQKPFYAANFDEGFFKEQYEKYQDTFAATRSSCVRLLLGHKDCPDWLREKYITSRHCNIRQLAYYGTHIVNKDFIIKHKERILSDRSSIIRDMFLRAFLSSLGVSTTIHWTSPYMIHAIATNAEIRQNLFREIDTIIFYLRHPNLKKYSIHEFLEEFVNLSKNPQVALFSNFPSIRELAIQKLKKDSNVSTQDNL
jgi:hypothetical protein